MESLEDSGLFASRKLGNMLAHMLMMGGTGVPETVTIP